MTIKPNSSPSFSPAPSIFMSPEEGSRQRVLGIMSDSSTGAFGITAIALLLIGKFALLSSLGFETAWDALVCTAAGLAVSLLLALYSRWKIGGLTGDVVGAGLELTELASLFSFL